MRAAELNNSLALYHGMRLADVLIGATSVVNMATLITPSIKPFGATSRPSSVGATAPPADGTRFKTCPGAGPLDAMLLLGHLQGQRVAIAKDRDTDDGNCTSHSF